MTLHEKLLEIRKSVTYLKKENTGYQYQYVSSSQALSSVRVKMDELGVLLIPSVSGKTVTEYQSKKDGNLFLTGLDMLYTWMDATNPQDKLECCWYAQGSDSGERGVGKAYTYSEKYFILKFFNIATDKDDPDAFQERRVEAGKKQKKTGAYQPDAPPPENAPNYPAQPSKGPQAGIENVHNPFVGKCLSISTPTTGTTNGKTWMRWDIQTQEMNLACFDKGVAEVVMNAIQDNLTVSLIWKRKVSTRTGVEQCLAEAIHVIDEPAI